ncbi:putative GMC oxidoreductase [Hypoxylon cercidicola]|nr:putative GMC oxidoreductase [Hypoxylon cercidicola]
MSSEVYDFIVVGGGTAGIVIATRLSEIPTQRVLVLEAGSDHSDDLRVKIPALYAALHGTEVDWCFKTEPQVRLLSLNVRIISLNQGKALGGSSAINNIVFTPPTKSLIDAWESLGNTGWNWDAFKDYYAKVYTSPPIPDSLEKELGVDKWITKITKTSGPLQLSFPESFDEKGYLMADNPWSDATTVGAFSNFTSVDPIRKERSYAANAYYHPVKGRNNLEVITNAVVEKILFDHSSQPPRAIGVQYRHEAHTRTVSAEKEVIVAAGGLQSPKLLEVSGIGNSGILQQNGIDVVKELKGVGENLQDHILCDFAVEAVDEMETLDGLARQEPEAIERVMNEFMVNRTGLLTSGGIKTYAYMPVVDHISEEGVKALKELLEKNRPSLASGTTAKRDLAYFEIAEKLLLDPTRPSAAYLTAIGQNPVAPDPVTGGISKPLEGKYLTIVAILAQPLSRGSVHTISKDISVPSTIDPRYLSNPVDIEILAQHVLYLQDVVRSTPLGNLLKQPLKHFHPAANFSNLEGAKKYIQARANTMWHLAGTCSMLPEEMGGVVDTELKVYGVENLRVVDSSVVPLLPPGNLQSTIYALAERAADIIKAAYQLS